MPFRRRDPKHYDEAGLYEYAVGALGRRMRSVAELKRLMRTKVGHQDDGDALVEAVVQRLKDQRYLNDTAYATTYSTLRKENDRFGQRRVVTDLKAKGVHSDVIEQTVASAYEGVNEEQLARDFIARKRLRKPADEKQAARIFRMLVRAGFGTRTIISILKKWDVDDDVLAAMETEPEEGAPRDGDE